MAYIEMVHSFKRYHMGDITITANNDVSFGIERGELAIILGSSGAGKSTVLNILGGMDTNSEGKVIIDGVDISDFNAKQLTDYRRNNIGFVFQFYNLVANLTAKENVELASELVKNAADPVQTLVDVGLGDRIDNFPAQLSGGQAQRTALARIMVSDPKLLLLDEPFSALDAHLRDKLMVEMRDVLAKFGREVIMVTHSRDEAYNMSREIAVMDSGKLLTKNKTKALFADPGSVPAAILTGCKNIASAEKRGEHEVYIPEWGVTLTTAQSVGDDVKAIGIRAHYFNPTAPTNRFAVEYIEEMEEPFEWIIEFRPRTAAADAQGVWWRLSKDKRPQSFPAELGIAPANILLLY